MSLLLRLLLLFWALWLSVVVATNLLDVLRTCELLPATFRFASGNGAWINQTMDPLGVPRLLQTLLYGGAIVWEALAAALFWWAAVTYCGRPLAEERIALLACGANLALWAAFQILDEVFLAYQPEAVHRAIFTVQLLTIFALQLLAPPGEPEKT